MFRNNKREIFGFRKYKAYGLASAVIAAFFLMGGVASADEVTSSTALTEPSTVQTSLSSSSSTETANSEATSATNEALTATSTSAESTATSTSAESASSTESLSAATTSSTVSASANASDRSASETTASTSTISAELTVPADRTVTATSSSTNMQMLDKDSEQVYNVNVSGSGKLPANSRVEIEVTTDLDDSNALSTIDRAVGTNLTWQGGHKYKVDLSGYEAGTQKNLIFKPELIKTTKVTSKPMHRFTTYKLFVDDALISTNVVTETFIAANPTIVSSRLQNRYTIVDRNNGNNSEVYKSGRSLVEIGSIRNTSIIKIEFSDRNVSIGTSRDSVTTNNQYNRGLSLTEHTTKLNDASSNSYLIRLDDDKIAKTLSSRTILNLSDISTLISARSAYQSDPSTRQILSKAKVTYYYSDEKITDLSRLDDLEHVSTAFDVETVISRVTPADGKLDVRFEIREKNQSVLETVAGNTVFATLSNRSSIDGVETIGYDLPTSTMKLNLDNRPLTHTILQLTANKNKSKENVSDLYVKVLNAETNEELGTVDLLSSRTEDRNIALPETIKELKFVPVTEIKVGTDSSSDIDTIVYSVRFNATADQSIQWKNRLDSENQSSDSTRYEFTTYDKSDQINIVKTVVDNVSNRISAAKLYDHRKSVFAPKNTYETLDIPLDIANLSVPDIEKYYDIDIDRDVLNSIFDGEYTIRYRSHDSSTNSIRTDELGLSESDLLRYRFNRGLYESVEDRNKLDFISIAGMIRRGTHLYKIPIKLTPKTNLVKTVDNANTISDKQISSVYTLMTYNAYQTVVSSRFEPNVSIDNDKNIYYIKKDNLKDLDLVTETVNATKTDIDISSRPFEAMSYIPKSNLGKTTVSASLRDAVTVPNGWKVQYSTDTITGDYSVDRNLTYTDSVDDYSKVTALKFIATSNVSAMSGVAFKIPITLDREMQIRDKVEYRSTLLTRDSEVLSTPIIAMSVSAIGQKFGKIIYNYYDKRSNKLLKQSESDELTVNSVDHKTFEDQIVAEGKTYQYNDGHSKSVNTTVIEGVQSVDRYYSNTNKTTVIVDSEFDESDKFTREFIEAQLRDNLDIRLHDNHLAKFEEGDDLKGLLVKADKTRNVTIQLGSDSIDDPMPSVYKGVITATLASSKVSSNDNELRDYLEKKLSGNNESFVAGDRASEGRVDHLYRIDKGSLTIRYVDSQGREIEPDQKSGDLASKYTNIEKSTVKRSNSGFDQFFAYAPDQIEKDGVTYTFKSSDKEIPSFVDNGEIVVTRVYASDRGSVIATYKDTEGNELAPQENVKTDAPDGEAYTTSAKTIKSSEVVEKTPEGLTKRTTTSYELTETPANAAGNVVGNQTITVPYVYRKVVAVQTNGSVIATYKDTEGNELASQENVKTDQPAGTNYQSSAKTIQGSTETKTTPEGKTVTVTTYELTKTPDNETGTVREGEVIEVPYVYRKNVEVRFIPGDAPSVETPAIKVTRYQTEDGTDVKDSVEGFESALPIIDHYQFTGRTDLNDGNDVQTHIYKLIETEIPGDAPVVDVPELKVTRYQTEDGTDVKDAEEGFVNAPNTIGNYQFTGVTNMNDGNDVQTHIYKLIETEIPGDAPIVEPVEHPMTRFVDEEGTEIKDAEDGLVPAKSVINDRYQFTGRTETTEDGTVQTHIYKLIEHEIPGDAPIVEVPEAHLTRYHDENGNDVAPEENGTHDKKDIDGYQFKTTESTDSVTTHIYSKIVSEVPGDAPILDKPVKELTIYVDEKGKNLIPEENGKKPKKDIPNYEFKITEDHEGVTVHVYTKVISEKPGDAPKLDKDKLLVTRHVDENGKDLVEVEKGRHPYKSSIKDYQYSGKTTEEDGITTHVYSKIVTEKPGDAPIHEKPRKELTIYVDEKGKELIPEENGHKPKKDIPNYEFKITEEHDGITVHVYTKTVSEKPGDAPVHEKPRYDLTRYIDEDGNEVSKEEKGRKPKKNVPGYEFKITEENDGITTHIYKKVKETPTPTPTPTPEPKPVRETVVPKAESKELETPKSEAAQTFVTDRLPDTGTVESSLAAFGFLGMIVGLVMSRRRKEDQ